MNPTLREGSRIEVQFTQTPQISPGMIVYIRDGERRLLHRITRVSGPFVFEKGDANSYQGIVLRGAIIGNLVSAA